jgi:4-amino-4-deoxy-L-arabinose transferase-like glycosyltransferase
VKSESVSDKEYLKIRRFFHRSWVQTVILLVFCSFLFIVGVGRWDLWNPDEPRYAQVSKEMVERGDWVLMHVNGNTYGDKPPLFFWLIALSSFLWQGLTSFSARFPSGLFGTLTVLLTYFLGKKLYGSRTGFVSALILATTFEFAYLSTRANIDATLTFFTTASIVFFLHWYQHHSHPPKSLSQGEREEVRENGGKRGNRTTLLIYGFYAGMAFATLAKGPVGFILPLMVSLVYLVAQKDWKAMKRMRLLTGMTVCFAIVLAWYLPAVFKGGQNFLNETLLHNTLDRFTKGSSHIRPFYYFLTNFPYGFLPWVLFLPGAIVYGFSEKKEGISKGFLFLLVWFVLIFLFFSLSKGKRAIYLLPLYPAASLLVGRFWDDYLSGSGRCSVREIWITLPVYFLLLVLLLAGMLLYTVPAVANFSVEPSAPKILKVIVQGAGSGAKYLSFVPPWSVISLVFLLVVSGILLFLAQCLRHKSLVFVLLVLTVGTGFFYATRIIFPLVNPYKSARFISEEILQTMKPGEKLLMYGDIGSAVSAQYNFYTGIVPILEIENEEQVIDLFLSKERVFGLFRYRDYEGLRMKHPNVPLYLITRRAVGGRDMALVSNR